MTHYHIAFRTADTVRLVNDVTGDPAVFNLRDARISTERLNHSNAAFTAAFPQAPQHRGEYHVQVA